MSVVGRGLYLPSSAWRQSPALEATLWRARRGPAFRPGPPRAVHLTVKPEGSEGLNPSVGTSACFGLISALTASVTVNPTEAQCGPRPTTPVLGRAGRATGDHTHRDRPAHFAGWGLATSQNPTCTCGLLASSLGGVKRQRGGRACPGFDRPVSSCNLFQRKGKPSPKG